MVIWNIVNYLLFDSGAFTRLQSHTYSQLKQCMLLHYLLDKNLSGYMFQPLLVIFRLPFLRCGWQQLHPNVTPSSWNESVKEKSLNLKSKAQWLHSCRKVYIIMGVVVPCRQGWQWIITSTVSVTQNITDLKIKILQILSSMFYCQLVIMKSVQVWP
jgi:hypothetical protein